MNRRGFRHGFETRFAYPLARRYPSRLLPSMSLIPLDPFTPLRAGYGAAGEFMLMIKQVASRCMTVGSVPACDERRAT